MAILTVEDLRRNSVIDPQPNGCWHWQRAKGPYGIPVIHTIDYERVTKRAMTGPRAVWNIAHGKAPEGLAFRRCGCADCVNPVHIACAPSQAEIGLHQRRAGSRKGKHLEAVTANLAKARASQGRIDTPEHLVREIRRAPDTETSLSISQRLGLGYTAVCKIRRGVHRKGVAA